MFPRMNPIRRALAAALAAFFVFPFVPHTRAAQDTVTGAFEGTGTDSRTGQPIARARIEFINQQTGVTLTKLSDSQGRFYQGLLPPRTYTLRARAQGYAQGETVQRLLGMRTGEVVPVPIVLDPATATPTPATTNTPPQPSPTTTTASASPTPASATPTAAPRHTAAETDR